jgi:MFS family permease
MRRKKKQFIEDSNHNEQQPIDNAIEKRKRQSNIKNGYLLASSGTRAFSDAILSPFLPLYGQSLGANSIQIGFIISITSLLSIAQLFWAFLAQKFKISRILAIISSYIASLFNFVLLPIRSIYTFASMRGLHSITLSATIPTSANLVAERTHQRSWALRNSLMQGVLVIGTMIGTLIGGILLWKIPTDLGYPAIFIGSGVIGLISAAFLHLAIPSRKRLIAKGRWQQIEEVDVTLSNTLATIRSDRNFVVFLIVNFIFIFGTNLSGPFYIVFNTTLKPYNLTIIQAALLTSIGLIPQTIASIITAKLIEKVRKKELLILAGIFVSFFPIFFMIPSLAGRETNVFWILIIIWCVNGLFWGIINSSLSILLLDIIHPRRRTLQLAINNSLSAVALFIAPIIGGFILEKTTTIYILLIISAVFRFVGATLFGFVKEPIIGGTILRPIQRVLPFIMRSNSERGVTIITSARQTNKTRIKPQKHKSLKKDIQ